MGIEEIKAIENIFDTQCINKPLDIDIIQNISILDDHGNHLTIFLRDVTPIVSDGTPYILFAGTKQTILSIKDEKTLRFILGGKSYVELTNTNNINFTSNNAIVIFINGHQLKIIYAFEDEFDIIKNVYIIDCNTNRVLITIRNGNDIYIDDMLASVCDDYLYDTMNYQHYHFVKLLDLPKSILPIVDTCLIMIKLSA